MKLRFSKIIQTVFFFGLGLAILYFVFTSQEKSYEQYCISQGLPSSDCNLWQKLIDDFKSVNLWWFIPPMIAYFLSNMSRAARWKMMVDRLGKPVKYWNAFWCVCLGYFANLGLPRSGEIIRPATLARYEKLPFDSVIGTVVLGRLVDMLIFMTFFVLALLWSGPVIINYLENYSDLSMQSIFLGVAGFLGLLLLFFLFVRLSRNSQNWLVTKVREFGEGVIEGLKTISGMENRGLFLFHSFFIWIMYLMMTWIAFYSFGPTSHLGLKEALTVLVFSGLGFAVPTPGGMGAYQAMVTASLELYNVQSADALSFSFILYFAIHIFVNLILGITSLLVLPIINPDQTELDSEP